MTFSLVSKQLMFESLFHCGSATGTTRLDRRPALSFSFHSLLVRGRLEVMGLSHCRGMFGTGFSGSVCGWMDGLQNGNRTGLTGWLGLATELEHWS